MEQEYVYLIFLTSFFALFFFVFLSKFAKNFNKKVPPSPPSWPIIGHLHLVKTPLHRFLQSLSYSYGPIFSLKFGSIPVVVVSSPRLLEECFSKNDIVFANRPYFLAAKYFGYNSTVFSVAPYGAHWRNMRRLLTLNMMSTSKLNSYYMVRNEEQSMLVKNLYDGSCLSYKRVEMRSRLVELTFNIVMRMATGKRYIGAVVENEEEAKTFIDINNDINDMVNASSANNFFKFLQLIDFQGYEKKLSRLAARSDMFLQRLVDRIRSQKNVAVSTSGLEESNTLVEEMLALQQSDPATYTDDIIKGQIWTVLRAGTDTSSGTIEWAMALLLNHPEILEKARAEIDRNIGHNELVDESNVSRVPYIQCIVNETNRLFPVLPLMIPHKSSEDCVVGGFHIKRGTMLFPNAWAIQRDPNVWEDPTSFRPERFEGDVKIDPYSFVPFGIGRRQCPGMGLANRVVGVSLGVLIQCFEWRRISDELIDSTEFDKGLIMPMNKPLEAMCKPRDEMIHILSKLST